MVVKGCIGPLFPVSDIDEMSLDRGRDGHGRRHEMRPATGPLAPFEITIAGRGAALSWLKYVGIHRQAHTETGFAPLTSPLFDQPTEPCLSRLLLPQARPWHNHCPPPPGDTLALGEAGRKAEIFDARVGA